MLINLFLSIMLLWVFSFFYVKLDDLVDDIILFIRCKIFKVPKVTRSSGDIMKDLKNSWLRDQYLNFYRFFLHIKEVPQDFKYWVREKYQRGKRGWAISDAWGFDWYLARVIAEGCEWLKKHKHGVPCLDGFECDENGGHTDAGFEAMLKEWDRRLDNIIWTFRMLQRMQEDHYYYQKSTEWTQEKADNFDKIWIDWKYKSTPRALTLEECQRYEKGWEYFKDHFMNLWD